MMQHEDNRIHITSPPGFFIHSLTIFFKRFIIGKFNSANPVGIKIIIEMNGIYIIAAKHIPNHSIHI